MSDVQTYREIAKADLFNVLWLYKKQGWRLAQISAAVKEGNDLLYSLERAYEMIHLRVGLAPGEGIESVSGLFSYAYLYENEMKDLFGIDVHGINADFEGKLYQTSKKAPFHAAPEGEDSHG